jgi:hypothetical protein
MSGVSIDGHGVTAVDISYGRALSLKLYIFIIILGMCMDFSYQPVASI